MATHRLESETGDVLDFVVDESGRIVELHGDLPVDEEGLVFTQGVPDHVTVEDVPEHISAWGAERGMDVCYYDPDHCRTCYCDDAGHMRCVGMC